MTGSVPGMAGVPHRHGHRVAIIVNPVKFTGRRRERTLELVAAACRSAGWELPLVMDTTAEDPGRGQARAAVAEEVDIVVPLGGDGTIRAVASGLLGTSTPMGLLPGGTGNLLARNLNVPHQSIRSALRQLLHGRDRPIDVAELTPIEPDEDWTPGPHFFLVMAGMGYDAALMGGAPERLKKRIGWPAYFVAGARNIGHTPFEARITVDGEAHTEHRGRTVVIGNCGILQAGIPLMPEAKIDDGVLDGVIINPRGPADWAGVLAHIVSRRPGDHRGVERVTGRRITVRSDSRLGCQLDGDVLGECSGYEVQVHPRSLLVRT